MVCLTGATRWGAEPEWVLEDVLTLSADSTESNMRYGKSAAVVWVYYRVRANVAAAYLRRVRDIARAGSRYTAYSE